MPSTARGPSTLVRQLSLTSAVALVVGQVIAVGIFLTPGTMIRTIASPFWIMVVWAVTGLMAVCGALCYGSLAARFPHAGGGYVYLREVYGRRIAFLYGWKCFLIMDPGITAALATGFAGYAAFVVPLGPASQRAVAIGAIVALAAVHMAGVRPGARLLTTLSALKIALVAGLIVAAAASGAGDWTHFTPLVARRVEEPSLAVALAGAFVAAFFTFGGWWEVTKIAGEVRDAPHTLPRALLVGLVVVTLVYVTSTLAFIHVVPIEKVASSDAFIAQVGDAIFGPTGAMIVTVIVLVCVLGSLGAMLMLGPRVYFAMAQDGLFPAAAAAVSRRGTPARAIALQAGLASVLVAVGTFDTIVAYFIFITVVFLALTVGSVFVLHRRHPSFRVPGYPVTPVIFLGLCAVLLVLLAVNNPLQAGLGVAVVAAGIPVFRILG